MNKNKFIIITGVSVIMLIVIIIGISYAWFSTPILYGDGGSSVKVITSTCGGGVMESCLAFNPVTKTIEGYYDYQDNKSSNPACPKTITIPSTICGIDVEEIADGTQYTGVFASKSITSVTFAGGSKLKKIGDYAFYDNSISGKVTLPNTITSIGKLAFYQSNTLLTGIANTTGKSFTWCDGTTGILEIANCSPTGSSILNTITITGTYARTVNVTAS